MYTSNASAICLSLVFWMFTASAQEIVWVSAGTMSTTRYFHSSTKLDNGKVLVAGGTVSSPFTALATCEIFDPVSNTWTPAGTMNYARQYIQSVKLPDGKVLVTGGYDGFEILGTCEIYNPTTGVWTITGSFSVPRTGHRIVLLPNGNVLAVGGRNQNLAWLSSCELYNPSLGTWTFANPMLYPRFDPELVVLNNGRVLVTGGGDHQTCEIFDPVNGTWSLTGSMVTPRRYHGITKLQNGNVLVTGGLSNVDTYANAGVEIYNPATGLWTTLANLPGIRWLHTSTLLSNGRVLITGGSASFYYFETSFTDCRVFDPATQSWQAFPSMSHERTAHTATLLPGDKILVVGGTEQPMNEIGGGVILQPRPHLLSVRDVRHDQGGRVTLRWLRSSLDTNVSSLSSYSIWRAIPIHGIPSTCAGPTNKVSRLVSLNGTLFDWELIGTQPAHRFASYSFTAHTLFDSSAQSNGRHYFLVSAQTNDPNIFYDSNIDSGYSVDNLPPAWIPSLAATSNGASSVRLVWPKDRSDQDVESFSIYRSTTGGFVPGNATFLATTADSTFVDHALPASNAVFYRVAATDVHGNQGSASPEASVVLTGLSGNQEKPEEFSLGQNYPNPFNPATTIEFSIARPAHVVLEIFDPLGRSVSRIVDGFKQPGFYRITWDADNVTSGVYFYKMSAQGFSATKKLLLLR